MSEDTVHTDVILPKEKINELRQKGYVCYGWGVWKKPPRTTTMNPLIAAQYGEKRT